MTSKVLNELFEQLQQQYNFWEIGIVYGLITIRTLMMVNLVPFIGSRAVSGRTRLIVSLVLAFFTYQIISPNISTPIPQDYMIVFALFLKEAFFGFVIGLITVMIFHALEAAGSVVDNQRGSANAQVFSPQLGQVSIFGLFYFWMSIAFFISIDGHLYFIKAFMMTFDIVPLLEMPILKPGISPFIEFFIDLGASVLSIAIQLSAPILISILLLDLVLGIANKMAPQINVFELGFSLKGYSGPLMIYVSLLVLVSQIDIILESMTKSVYKVAYLFAN